MIPYSLHSIGDEEIRAVTEVMCSGCLTGGPKVTEFEAKFAEYIGANYAIAVNSCAGALYLAVKALFPAPGGKIAIPALTYVATANAVVLAGHIPVFCDIDPETFCIDPAKIPDVDAVIPVHYGGHPCLTSETKVIIKKGKIIAAKSIGDIFDNLADFILCRDDGRVSWASILGVTKRQYKGDLIRVIAGEEILTVTPNHKFYTQEHGWIESKDLSPGFYLNNFDIINYENNLESQTTSNFETNLSQSQCEIGNRGRTATIYLETDQGKSAKAWTENEKTGVESTSISTDESNERDRQSLFGGNCRWGGDYFHLLSSATPDFYPIFGNIQYQQISNRSYYQNDWILAPSCRSAKMQKGGAGEKTLLLHNMEEFPSSRIDQNNFPISPSQKRTSQNSNGILSSTSRATYRDEIEFNRLFGSQQDSSIKWIAINSIERIPSDCSVFDIITDSHNYFANNFLVHNCDLDAIKNRVGWAIIEDAAHAAGAEYKGKKIGARNVCCFSFHPCKNMTTAEGGMITCKSDSLAEKLRRMRLNGIVKDGIYQDIVNFGFKFNMNEISAAIGIEQLKKLDGMNKRRREIAKKYSIELPQKCKTQWDDWPIMEDSNHLFPILVKNRDELAAHLQSKGVGCAIHYKPVHLMTWYREKFGYKEGDFPVAEDVAKHILSIPIYSTMTDEQVDYVIQIIKEAV